MDIVNIRIYEYSELENNAKEKAKRELTEILDIINVQDIEENAIEYLTMQGFSHIKDIRFSLNHCQGDGIAFYGLVDLKEYIEKQKIDVNIEIPYITVTIYKSNPQYNHYNSMEIESSLYDLEVSDDPENIEDGCISNSVYSEINSIIQGMKDYIKTISRRLETQSYNIIKSNEAEENIIELSNINKWKFFKDGSGYYPNVYQ